MNHHNIVSDLDDFDFKLLKKLNFKAIYFLAQSNKFRDFPNDSLDIVNINVKSPLEFIDWGIKNNVEHFVYTSSGGIYQNEIIQNESIKFETDNDLGFYLNSKLSAEIMLSNYKSHIKNLTILEPFLFMGKIKKERNVTSKIG